MLLPQDDKTSSVFLSIVTITGILAARWRTTQPDGRWKDLLRERM